MSKLTLPHWLSSARSIAIVGYGREGKSTHAFLQNYLPDASIQIFDAKEQFDLEIADVIFKSPGIYHKKIHTASSAYLTSQADLALQLFGKRVIGVTGTKGKSTTAHAINHVLTVLGEKSILVGNIGKPVLDYIDQIDSKTQVVFELSSFQTESLHTGPHIAVFTSLYQDHLDYYETLEEYEFAKKHLFDLLTPHDLCIYRDEYPRMRELLIECSARKIPYTKESHAYPVNYVPARLIAREFGYTDGQIDHVLATLQPLPGRLEVVAVHDGVRFVDDALATIPEATIDALDTLGSDVRVLIAGGHERGQDFSALAERIARSSIQTLILFPTTGERIARELSKFATDITVTPVATMLEAVTTAYTHAKTAAISSPIVLLSTASPSFGLFTDYQDRSEQYKRAITNLTS